MKLVYEDVKELVAELIEIGSHGIPAKAKKHLRPNRGYPSVLPYNKPLASELAETLSKDDLLNLIKGLILHSNVAGPARSGGSASPVPPIYAHVCELYPTEVENLTEWIYKYRVNPYDPHGHQMHIPAIKLPD